MKIIIQKNELMVLRFDVGDNLFETLEEFVKSNNINSGNFSAIGSAKEATLSYFNLETKQFEDQKIIENIEIVSLSGNIAWMNNEPIIHAHGVFSKKDLSTFGGHVKKLVISATCEVVLNTFNEQIFRKHDGITGLNLLQ